MAARSTSKAIAPSVAGNVEIFDRPLSRTVFARLASALQWVPMYHVRRTEVNRDAHPLDNYWYYPLASADDMYKGDATEALAALTPEFQPVKDGWDAVCKLVDRPVRLYQVEYTANAFGTEGHPHHDSPRRNLRSRHLTAIIYCNTEWDLSWGGETIVFDAKGDISAAVLPKPGRVTLLRGDPLHVARGVARVCPVPRRVLVYKMWSAEPS